MRGCSALALGFLKTPHGDRQELRQQAPRGAKPGPGLLASVQTMAAGKQRGPGPGLGLCRVPSSWLTRCLLAQCLPVSALCLTCREGSVPC